MFSWNVKAAGVILIISPAKLFVYKNAVAGTRLSSYSVYKNMVASTRLPFMSKAWKGSLIVAVCLWIQQLQEQNVKPRGTKKKKTPVTFTMRAHLCILSSNVYLKKKALVELRFCMPSVNCRQSNWHIVTSSLELLVLYPFFFKKQTNKINTYLTHQFQLLLSLRSTDWTKPYQYVCQLSPVRRGHYRRHPQNQCPVLLSRLWKVRVHLVVTC